MIYNFFFFINDDLDKMKQSFQDGVDTLYNKCVSLGFTPSDKTPQAICDAIDKIYNDRYNSGYNAGKASASMKIRIGCGMYLGYNGSRAGSTFWSDLIDVEIKNGNPTITRTNTTYKEIDYIGKRLYADPYGATVTKIG